MVYENLKVQNQPGKDKPIDNSNETINLEHFIEDMQTNIIKQDESNPLIMSSSLYNN